MREALRDCSLVIFDFDGTISWLRHGWPQIMLGICAGHVKDSSRIEIDSEELLEGVLSLNGKPSVHQISFLKHALGLHSITVEDLLAEYTRKLRAEVVSRTQASLSVPDPFLIYGVRPLLEALSKRGIAMAVVSGTYEPDVRREVELLGLGAYFGEYIFGSQGTGEFSKRAVMQRLLIQERIEGSQVAAFGDGPVEIEAAKALGGYAIGIASDEDKQWSHVIDPVKQKILVEAGADSIQADYFDLDGLLNQLFRDER